MREKSKQELEKEFRDALDRYDEHFWRCYPCHITMGYPFKTIQENIDAINKAIEKDEPFEFEWEHDPDKIY